MDGRDMIKKATDFRHEIFRMIEDSDKGVVWLSKSLSDIKKIVIINSAPRSGSSLLFTILRDLPGIYSMSGESVPFFRLNGLYSSDFSSDEVPDKLLDSLNTRLNISRDIMSDLSFSSGAGDVLYDEGLCDQYIYDLLLRFSLQWPQLDISCLAFRDIAFRKLKEHVKRHNQFDRKEYYISLLKALLAEYPNVNPYYYDLPPVRLRKEFPKLGSPQGPPAEFLIEEPLFITLSPRRRVGGYDFEENTLLLKTTVDSYRMNCIERLFPAAQIRIIHLTRNPAASINGLYDGWLHRGFFSHNLKPYFSSASGKEREKCLNIKGYSELSEWGKWWWNYDLPPGWQEYASRPLEEVCAFQWYSANCSIEEYISRRSLRCCRVSYENITSGGEICIREMGKVLELMGFEKDSHPGLGLGDLPVVQATVAPRPYRWKEKKDKLLSVLKEKHILELAERMGYMEQEIDKWV